MLSSESDANTGAVTVSSTVRSIYKSNASTTNNQRQQANATNYDEKSLSEKVKVGFYSSDRTTQTNESEIISLKSATENLEKLCEEISVVKQDLKFAHTSIQNQIDFNLNEKCVEIYGLINERLSAIKTAHANDLERIRRAYKSQLADAIVKINNVLQEKNSNMQMLQEMNERNADRNNESSVKIRELQRVLSEKEVEISRLESRESEIINNLNNQRQALVDAYEEEKQRLEQELTVTKKRANRIEEAFHIKEEETDKMMAELTNLQLNLEKEKIMNEQTRHDLEEFKAKADQEKQKLRKELEKQKSSLEAKMAEKLRETREQVMNTARQEMKQQQELQLQQQKTLLQKQKQQEEEMQNRMREQASLLEKERLEKERERMEREREQQEKEKLRQKQRQQEEQLLKERMSLTEALKKEKEKEIHVVTNYVSSKEDTELIIQLKNSQNQLKLEIAQLRRELEGNDEVWEKRVDVLKRNLHAIKDEMFLRQTLRKQSNQIAYASVAYTMDQQMKLQPQSASTSSTAKPTLPSIPNTRQPGGGGGGGGIDRPYSIPSRLSVPFETDEAQIVDEEEMNKIKSKYFNENEFIDVQ